MSPILHLSVAGCIGRRQESMRAATSKDPSLFWALAPPRDTAPHESVTSLQLPGLDSGQSQPCAFLISIPSQNHLQQ